MKTSVLEKKAKHAEVADYIKSAINREQLNKGDRIQSIRKLAEKFNTSVRVVQRGLSVLEDEGILVRVPRSGVFVSDRLKQGNGNIKMLVPVADMSITPLLIQSEYVQYQHGIIATISGRSAVSMEMIPVSKSNQYGDINPDALKLINRGDKVIVDGVWFAPVMEYLANQKCEVVYFNTAPIDEKYLSFISKWHCLYYSRQDAFDKIHLHLMCNGYRRPVLLSPFNDDESKYSDQYSIEKSFCNSAERCGLDKKGAFKTVPFHCSPEQLKGEALRKYIHDVLSEFKFDSIVIFNFYAVRELIGILSHDLKLRVPQDVGIVHWGDYSELAYQAPSVTAIRIPRFEMGKAAASILLSGKNQPTTTILPTQLIARTSTKRTKK